MLKCFAFLTSSRTAYTIFTNSCFFKRRIVDRVTKHYDDILERFSAEIKFRPVRILYKQLRLFKHTKITEILLHFEDTRHPLSPQRKQVILLQGKLCTEHFMMRKGFSPTRVENKIQAKKSCVISSSEEAVCWRNFDRSRQWQRKR